MSAPLAAHGQGKYAGLGEMLLDVRCGALTVKRRKHTLSEAGPTLPPALAVQNYDRLNVAQAQPGDGRP